MKKIILKIIKNSAHNLLLRIQIELCSITLNEVIEKVNKELDQKLNETITPLGYYISSAFFIEILESVDYFHKQKVIHRYLKPTNILITEGLNNRFVKICDFGLAVIHEHSKQSHTSDRGTVEYMAPQVVYGREYNTKAHIFSLGKFV